MITVTMEQIIDFRRSGDVFNAMALPLKAAYKINKIRQSVEKEADFYSDKFQEIIDEYAKKDDDGEYVFSDDGDQIMIKEGMVDECSQALEDLQKLEVQIENYNLTIEDLGEDIECTPDQLSTLMPFME